jgi:hypothetical protein
MSETSLCMFVGEPMTQTLPYAIGKNNLQFGL